MKEAYITAVLQLLGEGHDATKAVTGLKRTLKERGHERLLRPILEGVLRIRSAGEQADTILIVRDDASRNTNEAAITAAWAELGAETDPVVKTDPSLIGGFIAEHKRVRIDASYKHKLVTLYRSLTN